MGLDFIENVLELKYKLELYVVILDLDILFYLKDEIKINDIRYI